MKNIKKNVDVRVQLNDDDEPRVVDSVLAEFEYSNIFEDYVLTKESVLLIEKIRAKHLGRFDGAAVKKLQKIGSLSVRCLHF